MIDESTHQKTATASKDLIIICVVAILVFALASVFDVFGMVAEWSLQQHEGLRPLDEIVTVLVLLAFAFGIFSLRRWRELRAEVTVRKRLQEDLRKYQKGLEEKIQERAAKLTIVNEQLQREIPQRKLLEEALRDTEEKYRILVESATDMIHMIDRNHKVLSLNKAAAMLWSKEPHEIVGKSILDLFPEEIAAHYAKGLEEVFQTGRSRSDRTKMIAGGQESWISVSLSPVKDHEGRVAAVMGITRDITEQKQAEEEIRRLNEELEQRVIERTAQLQAANKKLEIQITEHKRAEEALRESEQHYRELADSINDVFFGFDKDMRYIYWNKASEKLTGIPAKDAIGKSLYELFPDTPQTRMAERVYVDVLRTQQSQTFVNEYELGGMKFFFEVSAYPSRDGLSVFVKDITERRRAEETLRESEEKYRNLVERANDGIVIVQDGIIKFINARLAEMRGVTVQEVIGTPFTDHIYPDELPEVVDRYKRRMAGEDVSPIYETALRCKDGSRIHAELNAGIVTYQGKPADLVIVRDITQRKRIEEVIRKSELQFRMVWENSADGMRLTDEHGTVLMVNEAFCRMVGKRKEAIEGKPLSVIYTEERQAYILRRHQERFSLRTVNPHFQRELTLWNGKKVWFGVSNSFFELEGQTPLLLGIFRDITERKRAEDTLRRSEEQHRLITGNTRDLVCLLDQDGNFIYASPSFREALGCEPEELMGSSFFSLVHPDDRVPAARTLPRALFSKNGRTVELRYKHQKGEWRIFESVWSWIFDENRSPQRAVVVSRDITERKRADQALRESEEKYRALFEGSKDTIYISTPDGKFLDINPAGIELFGYSSKEEILQVDIRDLYFNASDRDVDLRTIEQQGFVKDFELVLKRKDGQKLIVLETASAVRDDKGNVVAYRGIMRDVTKQKQLEQQFLQAQKMESIGRLAGGVAHDFNNVLTAIMGSADLVSRSMGGEEKLSHYVSVIKQAARRGGDLAKQLLTFARLETYTMRPVVVNEVLEETIKLVERTFEKSVEVKTRFAGSIPFISGDAGQLEQVFMNLCVNARDAMPDGGTLTIETRSASVDDAVEQKSPHFTSGEYVEVSISDTGAGMDEKTLQHIFEPFFTTKERDKGTGLGLAVVYGIVQSHKGFIIVESTVGIGTTFRIYLPIPEFQPKGELPVQQMHQEGVNGKGIVFVVDDDKMVQDLTEELLTGLGYHVLKLGSGEECIEVYRGRGKEIDLVILDMAMARMNGEETFRRLKLLNADVKVLIASGLIEPEHRRRMEEAGIAGFLEKPYQIAELANAVQAAMA